MDKKGEKMNSEWAVQRSARDGVHAFSNRALKITWEAPMTLHAASSIVFLAVCFVSNGAAFIRALSLVRVIVSNDRAPRHHTGMRRSRYAHADYQLTPRCVSSTSQRVFIAKMLCPVEVFTAPCSLNYAGTWLALDHAHDAWPDLYEHVPTFQQQIVLTSCRYLSAGLGIKHARCCLWLKYYFYFMMLPA